MRTVLVTGASGGIGYALARVFAEHGYDLVLVARSAGKLEEIARDLHDRYGITATPLPFDLSNNAAPQALAAVLEQQHLEIDFLVNNAGIGTYGYFWETKYAEEEDELHLNVLTLTLLTKLLLPPMLSRGYGKILNISSTAAFQPGPLMATYYASKAYILSFTEALAEELRGTGVTATVLCPGPTTTGFHARARIRKTKLLRLPFMDAATVARIGYRALLAGKRVVIPGLRNSALAILARFSPRRLVTRIVRLAQEPSPE